MRADRNAQHLEFFTNQSQAVFIRVDIQEQVSGIWRDITLRSGYNMLSGAKFSMNVDQPGMTLDLSIKREIFQLSMAPLITKSKINAVSGSYSALVRPNANVRAYVQVRASGQGPVTTGHVDGDGLAGAWIWIFDGQIDSPDSGADPMQVSCSDLISRLQRTWIKTERVYGVWQASTRVLSGTVVVPSPQSSITPNNLDAPTGPWWQAQSTFTTGTTEPTWLLTPIVGTSTVTDGAGNVWKCISTNVADVAGTELGVHMQQILDDNMGVGAWALTTVGSTFQSINPYKLTGMSVWQALQNVADIIGWVVRYVWDNGSSTFKLKFFDPVRTGGSSVQSFQSFQYNDITTFKQDISTVRNDIDVRYFNSVANVDASGNPIASTVNVQDATSIAANGDLYAAIAEGAATGINDATTAARLANAALTDLAQVPIQTQIEVNFLWWLELNDLVTLVPNGLQFDSATLPTTNWNVLAVYGIELTCSTDGSADTMISLRSAPCSGVYRWHDKLAGGGRNGGSVKTLTPHGVSNIVANSALRGARISYTIPSARLGTYRHTELHVSSSSGFTPASATLRGTGTGGYFLLGDLTPGITYYYRLLHKDARDNAGVASAERSFVAGQVQTTDIANSAVLPTQLSTPLRTFARMVMPVGPELTYPGNDIAITWKTTADIDPAAGFQSDHQNWKNIISDGWFRVRVHMHWTTNVVPGDRLQLYIVKATGATVTAYYGSGVALANTDRAGADVMFLLFEEIIFIAKNDQIRIHASLTGSTTLGALTTRVMKGPVVAATLAGSTTGCWWEIERLPYI